MKLPENFPLKYALIIAIALVAVGGVGYGVMMGNQSTTPQVVQPVQDEQVLNDSAMMDNLANGTDDQNAQVNKVSDETGDVSDYSDMALTTALKHVKTAKKPVVAPKINKPVVIIQPPAQTPAQNNNNNNQQVDNGNNNNNNGTIDDGQQHEGDWDPLEDSGQNPDDDTWDDDDSGDDEGDSSLLN